MPEGPQYQKLLFFLALNQKLPCLASLLLKSRPLNPPYFCATPHKLASRHTLPPSSHRISNPQHFPFYGSVTRFSRFSSSPSLGALLPNYQIRRNHRKDPASEHPRKDWRNPPLPHTPNCSLAHQSPLRKSSSRSSSPSRVQTISARRRRHHHCTTGAYSARKH
jgi:hypothetical protein